MERINGYCVDVSYSSDDNGWYIELYDCNGKTVYETPVYESLRLAQEDARHWTQK